MRIHGAGNYHLSRYFWVFDCFHRGETVFVPSGQSLLIDSNTGYLHAIFIEGEVIVKDIDITIKANYIIIANGGSLIIGTASEPF